MNSLKNKVHINLDVGEGVVDESQMYSLVSAVNIACGGHAGDNFTMSTAIKRAQEYNNQIGLHPSYEDRENFGRHSLKLPLDQLMNQWERQYDGFINILIQENAILNHCKPHGALYNDLLHDTSLSEAFVKSLSFFKKPIKIYTMQGSALHKEAESAGYEVEFEAFLDRSYASSLKLTPRSQDGAVIEEPKEVLEQLYHLKNKNGLHSLNGEWIPIEANTYCLHSDHPNTLSILNYLHRNFDS